MCGIAGAVHLSAGDARSAVALMCAQMVARGPDDHGIASYISDRGVVALGARRLAVIDPSPAGRQPMRDVNRGTTIVFNGMIYNFRELRAELEMKGERFESSCDTEVVLRAYGHYGRDCVRHMRGMFAFAVWDERDRSLLLARDRLGIKPLYYHHSAGGLLFASQVKALLAGRIIPTTLSEAAVGSFLAFGAVSEPLTAIQDVLALPAGHRAVLRNGTLDVERYWEAPAEHPAASTRAEALEELQVLLDESVRRHMVSDAPLGVFLSGGLDSSLVAALAARHTDRVRTVSVIFDDAAFAETRYMKSVADLIGSEHVAVHLRPPDLLASLDGAFAAMDQPTFDGINTYVVSRAAAATGLTVALSGLGADELFDGYGYVKRVRALERAHRLPSPVARLVAYPASQLLRGERGDKAFAWLGGDSERGSSYDLLRRLFLEPDVRRLCGSADPGVLTPARVCGGKDLYHQISELDLTNYMKNVLLRDTDAMSMSQSLEVRVPFLDHPLVEWALRQPERVKGTGKTLLAAVAADVLPAEVLARRKQGFVLPLSLWMRAQLREEVGSKLRQPPALLSDLVDSRVTAAIWDEYLATGRRWLRPWGLYALARWVESLEGTPP